MKLTNVSYTNYSTKFPQGHSHKVPNCSGDSVSFTNKWEDPEVMHYSDLFEYSGEDSQTKKLKCGLDWVYEVCEKFKGRPRDLKTIFLVENDVKGKIPAHYFGANEIKAMGAALKSQPDLLKTIFLQESWFKKIPAMYYGPEEIKAMAEVLKVPKKSKSFFFWKRKSEKDEPESTIRKIFLWRGMYRNSLAHHYNAGQIKAMGEVLKDEPETLREVFLARNDDRCIPAHHYKKEEMQAMCEVLKDQPETIKKIFETEDKEGRTPDKSGM